MSVTDFATFVGGLASLSITGVNTKFDHIPQQLSTAQLPAMFVRLPEGTDGPLTLSTTAQGGWPTLTCEMVIAVEPQGQNRATQNYKATVALIDHINNALRGIKTGDICQSKIRWSIRGEQDWIGEQLYWLIVVRVTGNG
jgi:hypothetical protein